VRIQLIQVNTNLLKHLKYDHRSVKSLLEANIPLKIQDARLQYEFQELTVRLQTYKVS